MSHKLTIIKAAGLALAALCSSATQAVQVDFLALYDDAAEARFNGNVQAAMSSWVDNSNQAYIASQVDIQLRLVGVEKYNASANSMSDKLSEIRLSTTVGDLRDRYGADFVALISNREGGICGIGYVSVSAGAAFNVSGAECGYITLTHELGHNMGLTHSRRQGDQGGTRYGYALGYGVDNQFSTIMAYPQAFNTFRRVNQFSDPGATCQGLPCGVAIGDPQEADAHTALNNVKADLASFRSATNGGGGGGGTGTGVSAPSDLRTSLTPNNSVNLNWRDNSNDEDRFIIKRSTSANSGFVKIGTTPAGVSTYTDTQVAAGQTYFYRVRARKGTVNSPWSNTSSITIPNNVGDNVLVPPPDGTGMNLENLSFRGFPRQVGSDGWSDITNAGATMIMENNVWLRTDSAFTIGADTVLEFDFSSDNSGEIHGIGFDTNGAAESSDIFKLSGSQPWGIRDYTYTGAGRPQHFSIPVGNYFSGDQRLVLTNDNDAGSGNISYFSNIRIYNPGRDTAANLLTSRVTFGLDPVDDNTAILFYEALVDGPGQAVTLCLDSDCDAAEYLNGRYQRELSVEPDKQYLIEYESGACLVSAIVESSESVSGVNSTACQ